MLSGESSLGGNCRAATQEDSNPPSLGRHLDPMYRMQEKWIRRKDWLSTGKFAAADLSLRETLRLFWLHSQDPRASSNTSVSTFNQGRDVGKEINDLVLTTPVR